ncbi:hypothetical protein L2E82_08078 [Cichorium intybus]|uniref:Uncharacterized protein n=1 Tax=Cichorium intybus TaxID=13427 RepID=A0ACB9G5L5_CICIN|nr:hypothetical protein L2E82_08078 [Cichorium intybus]
MSVLFPRKSIRISQPSSNNVGVGIILETPSSKNTVTDANQNVKSSDACNEGLQMNWKVLEEISESLNQKKGESLRLSSVAIKKELDKCINTLATVLEDGKSCGGEDTMGKVIRAFGELKVLSSTFDTSEHKEKHSVFTSDAMKSLQVIVESLQGSKPLIDDFLKKYVKTQDVKVVQKVVSEGSSTSEVHQEEDNVQEAAIHNRTRYGQQQITIDADDGRAKLKLPNHQIYSPMPDEETCKQNLPRLGYNVQLQGAIKNHVLIQCFPPTWKYLI